MARNELTARPTDGPSVPDRQHLITDRTTNLLIAGVNHVAWIIVCAEKLQQARLHPFVISGSGEVGACWVLVFGYVCEILSNSEVPVTVNQEPTVQTITEF